MFEILQIISRFDWINNENNPFYSNSFNWHISFLTEQNTSMVKFIHGNKNTIALYY